ncbi:MAG: bifunctional phosphopantothenoylcysteine decarboxylase/phosphopantothenate--cysteine ligase CoaBC [Euryarchaeota archaeon]|nr:bifunctional phosphopantothenoylcysteine decarboxylase/phosphopantothenate--cysteine ligase CoaBC [Euryarchaeota archaeon]
MHPSDRIRYARGNHLGGKKIALAVTGSIAAVEAVKVARELIRYGAEVYPYMTHSAGKFIGKDALLFATGHEPITELSGMDEHLEEFDIILVSPATGDIISKAACGIADDAVSTLILANLRKCIFVPAMSEKMYTNPMLKENIEKLKGFARVVEPKYEEGEMKLPGRERITAEVIHSLGALQDKKILIVGGAGYAPIDEFRIITNLSTGRTAVEIAKEAYFMGATVHLLMGLHSVSVPEYIPVERFTTVESLIGRIDKIVAEKYDAIIVPAALPDFAPEPKSGKIEFEQARTLKLKKVPKFLEALRKKYHGYLVGFKAEFDSQQLIEEAKDRMRRYNLNMVVANNLSEVKEKESRVHIITEKDVVEVAGTKSEIAREIMMRVANEI